MRAGDIRHEQDRVWWDAIGEAARKVMRGRGDREIDGLAICSTSSTILLTDANGSPLTPALMYNDGRASEETRLAQGRGRNPGQHSRYQMQLFRATQATMAPAFGDQQGAAARMMHSADFVASLLAGEAVATDWSHALKTGYDAQMNVGRRRSWSGWRVPVRILPSVVRPGTQIGEVEQSATEHRAYLSGRQSERA